MVVFVSIGWTIWEETGDDGGSGWVGGLVDRYVDGLRMCPSRRDGSGLEQKPLCDIQK